MFNMYLDFVKNELKKYVRDPLMRFMMFYPIILGLIGRYVIPWISNKSNFKLNLYADFIIVVLIIVTPHIYGALIGFSILEDRDDNIFTAIRVTPLSMNEFLSFRLAMVTLLSFISSSFVMWFSNIVTLPLKNIFAIAFLVSLAAPMTGLFINFISKNKIEGFAVMKGTGIILIFPIISLFYFDKKELFFSFAPGFWPAKAISTLIRGKNMLLLSYNEYYFIGFVYVILLNIFVYKTFIKVSKK